MHGTLESVAPAWSDEACVGVALASGGYPEKYETGFPISGLGDVDKDILVFHAGTRAGAGPGEILTNGGRVLTVVARGKTLNEARERVYANVPRIHFHGCHYRTDIALVKDEIASAPHGDLPDAITDDPIAGKIAVCASSIRRHG